jgi:hypothetical protein
VSPVDSLSAPQAEQQVDGCWIVVEDGAPDDRAHLPGTPDYVAGREEAAREERIALRGCQVA